MAARGRIRVGDRAPVFYFIDHSGARGSTGQLSGRPVVLVFLRYAGCPVCQLDAAELGRASARFGQSGAALLIVVQSPAERAATLAGLALGARVIPDPEGALYELHRVRSGNMLQYAAPAVLAKARRAAAAGYRHGPSEGRERQLPAAFVIGPDGIVAFAHYGRNVADAASPEALLAAAGRACS